MITFFIEPDHACCSLKGLLWQSAIKTENKLYFKTEVALLSYPNDTQIKHLLISVTHSLNKWIDTMESGKDTISLRMNSLEN